nr:7204_t:CDS:2 [Entrophospora candida]
MANVHTLQDINSKGHQLGSMREKELEEKLNFTINSIDETNDLSKKLLDKYSDQEKSFKREKKTWSLERKGLNREVTQNNNELQNLRTQALEFANINKQLRRKNKYIERRVRFIPEKMKEVNYFQSRIKLLEEELFSAQNDSSLIKSEFLSLKSKLAELEHMNNELVQTKDELSLKVGEVERLKLEAISRQVELQSDESIVGDNEPQVDEFKIPDISANNKPIMNLRKYLRKDILEKNSEASTAKIPEGNVTPQVAKQINIPSGNIPNSPLNKSNSKISVGGIEAIPAMASVIISFSL